MSCFNEQLISAYRKIREEKKGIKPLPNGFNPFGIPFSAANFPIYQVEILGKTTKSSLKDF